MTRFDVRFPGSVAADWPGGAAEFAALEGGQAGLPADVAGEALGVLETLRATGLPVWVDRLREGGVAADRLTSPDLGGQLLALLRRPVDTIICNLLDEEPSLRVSSSLAARYPQALLLGVGLLVKLTGARRGLMVVEAGSPGRWWAPVRQSARQVSAQLVALRNDYPQADPTLLLHTLLGRRLRPRRLPTEVGALLLDAAAAVAIGQCVGADRPLRQLPVGLYDHVRQQAHYLAVPVGTKLEEVLRHAAIPPHGRVLRAGHPLRDVRLSGEAALAGGELTIHATPPETPRSPAPCIRCSWCLEGCPVRIHPAGLLEAAQHEDPPLADHFGLEACIECGICSYVCPSHLPLLGGVRKLRGRSG